MMRSPEQFTRDMARIDAVYWTNEAVYHEAQARRYRRLAESAAEFADGKPLDIAAIYTKAREELA